MELFNAETLQPLPAWFWFIDFFKILGFSLHMVPMNLWYAGTIIAMALFAFGGEQARRFSTRFMLQLPIIIALGINFGIVPLLFLQVAYSRAFYPATILMAWAWMAIILMLIPAYYGVYLYSFGLREGGRLTAVKKAAGWLAAILFIAIGFTFANGLSLTANVDSWGTIWAAHSVDGAATGTALNTGDPSLWPRWLMMFGFAMITTSVWMVIDAVWLGASESESYKAWAISFARKLSVFGAGFASLAGAHYMFATWSPEAKETMWSFPLILLTGITAISPWFAPSLLWFWRSSVLSRSQAAIVGGAQFGMVALNAISRQLVQNAEVSKLYRMGGVLEGVSDQAVEVQWGSMLLFLVTFVLGAGGIAWIVAQVIKSSGEPLPPSEMV